MPYGAPHINAAMSETPPRLAVVIPTRNRANLAIGACNALMAQQECALHICVSDNSTAADQVEQLAEFCRRADPAQLTYLRPPEPLAMAAHWDWALSAALDSSEATHYVLHYDRRIVKPDHLTWVAWLMQHFPEDVVTWTFDQVIDEGGTRHVSRMEWDGRCYAITTARLAELTSRGKAAYMGFSFPFLSNCLVPRAVLTDIRQRFGNICDSTGPDACFTYRFCAIRERYVHFDRALFVGYAMDRSAGWGYFTGRGGDFHDFVKSAGADGWLSAAPIPGLSLGQNIMYHEYELVRRATGHPAFKPIDMRGYISDLAACLRFVADRNRAAELERILVQHAGASAGRGGALRVRDGWPWLRRFIGDLGRELVLRSKVFFWRIHRRGVATPATQFFDDDARALESALTESSRPVKRNRHLRFFRARDMALEPPRTPPGAAVVRRAG